MLNVLKKPVLIIVALGLLAVFGLGYGGSALAGSGNPGSASDPLVTRSFVEKYVQDYVNKNSPAPPVTPVPEPGTGTGSLAWSIAELEPGEEFLGRASTEFIVRSGAAVVLDPTGSGIPDLTSGTNVKSGQPAAPNHLFIVPKDDGRGIKATKATIIMYRGF